MTDIVYVELEDALWLHFDLMRQWSETRCGLDHRALLESALGRPKHAAVYEDADIVEQAATLCFGLIKNHPWLGGNKRTATHIIEAFVKLNGFRIDYETREMVWMVLEVESDEWKVDKIEVWLRPRIIKIEE